MSDDTGNDPSGSEIEDGAVTTAAPADAPAPAPKRGRGGTLASKERRLAYLLLLPTMLVLVTIAIYPLGQVFYKSFTNDTFASAEETEWVGLDNYANLLKVTIREMGPEIDPETGEEVVDPDTGEVVYESPIDVLPREPTRYREAYTFDLGILPDRLDSIQSALQAAAKDHDLLITSGGVSLGEEDHVKAAVEANGALHFWRLAIKPGKPIALGQVGGNAVYRPAGQPGRRHGDFHAHRSPHGPAACGSNRLRND